MIILFLSDGKIIIVPKEKVEECLKIIEKALDEGKKKSHFWDKLLKSPRD